MRPPSGVLTASSSSSTHRRLLLSTRRGFKYLSGPPYVVAAVFWLNWFCVERRVETSFVRLGFMVDMCDKNCFSCFMCLL
jgi:hypothetical protein